MKDDPWRQRPESYPLRFGTRILFADMDGFRHLNNGATGRFFEEGRASFNIRLFGVRCMIDPDPGQQILFANVAIDFVRQAHYPGEVEVATGCARVGNSSYVLSQAAFQHSACFALSEAVMVKAMHGRPAPLNEAERATLTELMVAG